MGAVYKRYIAINSLGSYLFYFFIFAPLYAAQNGISVENAGWIFSVVSGVQAVFNYPVGRIFENISPNIGVILGRAIFSLGPLILFFKIDPLLFTLAMILASFFDVFFPSMVLYERAIFPPSKRESSYRWMIFLSETVKMAFIIPIILTGLQVSGALFFSQFIAAIAFIILFYLLLPKVDSGRVVGGGEIYANRKNLFFIYMGQLFVLLAFNLSGVLIKSYYLNEVLKGTSKEMLISEVFYSLTIVLIFPLLIRKNFSLKTNMVIGTIFMAAFFFIMAIPNMYAFYLAHAIIGAGFLLWQPSKDALKFQNAPEELGRWEGFFQGVNIFSRIIFPPLAAYIATKISFLAVYIIAGVICLVGVVFYSGVKS